MRDMMFVTTNNTLDTVSLLQQSCLGGRRCHNYLLIVFAFHQFCA